MDPNSREGKTLLAGIDSLEKEGKIQQPASGNDGDGEVLIGGIRMKQIPNLEISPDSKEGKILVGEMQKLEKAGKISPTTVPGSRSAPKIPTGAGGP